MSDIGYMCMIAHTDELGKDPKGTTVYPTLKALKANHPSWAECGIVMVDIRPVEVVCPPKKW